MEGDELSEGLADVKNRWKEACEAAAAHAQALRACGLEGGTADSSASLPRLNALAQDCLASLRSLQRQFDLLSQQLISVKEKDACLMILEDWKREYQSLHSTLRSANLQAKANIRKAAKSERDLLLGGGEESTNLRRNLQTQAGMSAAAESVTESLRRTRQMMVQELERGFNTLATLDESSTTLRKADSEYKGQRSLLIATRGLLSVLKRKDIVDRIILVAGFIFFSLVVTYVFNQRIGIFKMQRTTQVPYGVQESHVLSSPVSIDIPPEPGTEMQLKHSLDIRECKTTDIPPELGTEMQLKHSPDIRECKTTELIQEKSEATESLSNCPTVGRSNSVPTIHTEL